MLNIWQHHSCAYAASSKQNLQTLALNSTEQLGVLANCCQFHQEKAQGRRHLSIAVEHQHAALRLACYNSLQPCDLQCNAVGITSP